MEVSSAALLMELLAGECRALMDSNPFMSSVEVNRRGFVKILKK